MRRRIAWALITVAFCGGAAATWVVASRIESPDQAAARADEPIASWITAKVENRPLAATVIQRGDVRPESSISVQAPSSVEGTSVVTQRPVSAGDPVTEGERVIEVSGRPVFVLAGEIPVYRTLRPGMAGPDVSQLQDALARLGYAPDVDGIFGEATKVATDAFYANAGYQPIVAFETGDADIEAAEVEVRDAAVVLRDAEAALSELDGIGTRSELAQAQVAKNQAERSLADARAERVANVRLAEEEYNAAIRARDRLLQDPTVGAPDVEAAELAIQQAETTLNELRRSTAGAVAAAEEALELADLALSDAQANGDATGAEREVAAASDTLARSERNLAATLAVNGPTIAQGEIVFVPELPARVQAVLDDDDATTGDTSLLGLSSGELVVTTSIRTQDVSLIRIGMPVELLEELTADTHAGRIAAIAADARVDPTGQVGFPAVIEPDEPLPDRLSGANVRATITAATTESSALVVPVAAVSSGADGSARVSVVASMDDADPREIEVTTGLSADGMVVVEPVDGGTLDEGDLVVIGR